MGYVAGRTLRITETETRDVGDPVPEAADWPTLHAYLSLGWVKEVPDAEMPKPKPVQQTLPSRPVGRAG